MAGLFFAALFLVRPNCFSFEVLCLFFHFVLFDLRYMSHTGSKKPCYCFLSEGSRGDSEFSQIRVFKYVRLSYGGFVSAIRKSSIPWRFAWGDGRYLFREERSCSESRTRIQEKEVTFHGKGKSTDSVRCSELRTYSCFYSTWSEFEGSKAVCAFEFTQTSL